MKANFDKKTKTFTRPNSISVVFQANPVGPGDKGTLRLHQAKPRGCGCCLGKEASTISRAPQNTSSFTKGIWVLPRKRGILFLTFGIKDAS